MKNKNIKAASFFFIAPPLFSRRGYGFAVIQLGLDFSESLLLRTAYWSGEDYLKFWHKELTDMLSCDKRRKGILPTGIYTSHDGRAYFLERWEAFRLGSEFVFHDRTVVADDDVGYQACKLDERDWWQLIPDYARAPVIQDGEDIEYESEWRVTVDSVADWCHKYSCVFAQMDNVDFDVEFKW